MFLLWVYPILVIILVFVLWFWTVYRKTGFVGLRKRMRYTGILLCLALWVTIFGLMNYGHNSQMSPEKWQAILLLGFIINGSAIVSWKWELIGAILLIIEASLGLIAMLIFRFGELFNPPLWINLFLPFSLILLVPGILFIVSWCIGRSQTGTSKE